MNISSRAISNLFISIHFIFYSISPFSKNNSPKTHTHKKLLNILFLRCLVEQTTKTYEFHENYTEWDTMPVCHKQFFNQTISPFIYPTFIIKFQ